MARATSSSLARCGSPPPSVTRRVRQSRCRPSPILRPAVSNRSSMFSRETGICCALAFALGVLAVQVGHESDVQRVPLFHDLP